MAGCKTFLLIWSQAKVEKKDLLKVFNKATIRDSSSKSSKHILISLSDDCIGPDLFGLDLQKTCDFVL